MACAIYFRGVETFSGSWEGIDPYEAHGHFLTDGTFEFVGMHYFTGLVRGCGTGGFTLDEQGTVDGHYDPLAGEFHVKAEWQLVRKSGSGGLAKLRARSGTFTFVISAAQTFEDGQTDGTMTCHPRLILTVKLHRRRSQN